METRIQHDGEALQEVDSRPIVPVLHDNHFRRGPDKGGNKTINEALRQTKGLEVVKLAIESSVRLWKTNDRALCKSRTLTK
jgi:hypothetical protein